jgi:hypothetical protein
MKNIRLQLHGILLMIALVLPGCIRKPENEGFHAGWAMEDITPDGPVSLQGQFYERISEYVQSPLMATALAMELSDGNTAVEQAILVSLDVVMIPGKLQDTLRMIVKDKIPDFDTRKLVLNAIHTHASFSPALRSKDIEMLLSRLSKVVVTAWNNREPSGISYGLGYAVVGHNRRVKFSDGTSEMYGNTARPDFTGIEGPSDPSVDMLFTWNLKKKLTGVIMNVSCPAQVTESKYYVSSDYFGEVRKHLNERFSGKVYVLPQIGAAGDQSPRDLSAGYKAGEPNMWDVPGIVEIGNRLMKTFDDVYAVAENSIRTKPVFSHVVEDITLPVRKYTEDELAKATEIVDEIKSREPADPDSPQSAWNRFLKEMKDNEKVMEYGPWDNKLSDFGQLRAYEGVIRGYNSQKVNPEFTFEMHVIRLGDVVIATNPFELFAEYGMRITGRSKASQVFIVELCGDHSGYLPTAEAAIRGGYSGITTRIGPPGGDTLVEKTVGLINALW